MYKDAEKSVRVLDLREWGSRLKASVLWVSGGFGFWGYSGSRAQGKEPNEDSYACGCFPTTTRMLVCAVLTSIVRCVLPLCVWLYTNERERCIAALCNHANIWCVCA